MIKMWSFFGILGQVISRECNLTFKLPLIHITERLKGKHVGNVIFWVSIMLGQPFIVMTMYRYKQRSLGLNLIREWYLRTYGNVQLQSKDEINVNEQFQTFLNTKFNLKSIFRYDFITTRILVIIFLVQITLNKSLSSTSVAKWLIIDPKTLL